MIRKKLKHLLYRYVLPYGGLMAVRLISLTYRVRVVGLEKEKKALYSRNRLVYASWHQRFFPGIVFFSTRKPIAIIISKSLDGEMIARAAQAMGWIPVRGSSSHGGRQALQTIRQLAQAHYNIGHIVDGPTGPFGVVKPGLIKIAQAADLPILPTITSAQHRWVFNSWDRFMVPKPFSRIIIRFGNAIYVPAEMSKDEFESQRKAVEQQMKSLYEQTDQIWSCPEKIQALFS